MRLFIAISLPSHLVTAVGRFISDLRPLGKGIRWTRPENLHLTLNFPGAAEPQHLPGICDAMRRAALLQPTFALETGSAGAFPHLRHPQVLWIGLGGDGLPALHRLQAALCRELQAIGFPAEQRPYHPHLTLARITHTPAPAVLLEFFRNYPLRPFLIPVDEIHLMSSELSDAGPRYSLIGTTVLGSRP